jgi:NAD dependent epimerase/dehydratase family enzyme
VRLLLGQMGEELLLPSLRVVPRQALQAGFIFRSPDLLRALRFALQRG